MTRGRIFFFVVAAVVSLLAAWIGLTTDWSAYGPAEPPENVGPIDTSIVTLQSVTLGAVDALNQPVEFTWSQFQPVKVVGKGEPGKVRPDFSELSKQERKRLNGDDRCSPSIFIQIFRKSSLGDGSVRVGQVGSRASVNKDGKLTWEGEVWIPRVPGRYLVRVTLMCAGTKEKPAEENQRTLGTFYLDVRPGE